MSEEITEAAPAAEEKAVAETGQAEPEQQDAGESEKISRSKDRRDQRKAQIERLRTSEAEAKKLLEAEQQRLDRLREAASKLPEPKESEFDKYEDYLAARTAYASVKALDGRNAADIEAEIDKRRQEVAQAKVQSDQQLAENWRDHAEEAKGRYSDFEKVVYAAPITERLSRAIIAADQPADVAYRIALDPTLARDLSAMSDLDMGRAIGRIEASLSMPRPKTETSAPAPITPVTPTGGTIRRDPSQMSPADYRKQREAGWKP